VKVVWTLALLAGCYGPSFAPGAPCDPAIGNCPAGQTCQLDGTDHRCLAPGTATDAAVDAAIDEPDAGPTDVDGDGIVNASDNCPALANPSQHDEDSDAVGDLCDPCPVSPVNTDTDGDGVGNDCDPRPGLAGDTFVLFEPFAQGLPAGWTTNGGSAWSVANDELRVTSGSSVVTSVRTNIPATPRMMAVTSVVADQMFGSLASVGIMLPYASMLGGGGILCSLFQATVGNRFLSLYNTATDVVIDNHAFSWVDDVPYILAAVKVDNAYECVHVGGVTANGTSSTAILAPTIGLRSEGATARFRWLMIVKTP